MNTTGYFSVENTKTKIKATMLTVTEACVTLSGLCGPSNHGNMPLCFINLYFITFLNKIFETIRTGPTMTTIHNNTVKNRIGPNVNSD